MGDDTVAVYLFILNKLLSRRDTRGVPGNDTMPGICSEMIQEDLGGAYG